MKSDKEILQTLRRFKEAKIELKKYLSWIEQIKLEIALAAQSEKQINYYKLQSFDTIVNLNQNFKNSFSRIYQYLKKITIIQKSYSRICILDIFFIYTQFHYQSLIKSVY